MKTRSLVAELISEVACEVGYFVFRYDSLTSSSGTITFETESVTTKYKILDYLDHTATLYGGGSCGPISIDLHDPGSLDVIKVWFENLHSAFDVPSLPFDATWTITTTMAGTGTGYVTGGATTTTAGASLIYQTPQLTTNNSSLVTTSLTIDTPDNIFDFNPEAFSLSIKHV